MEEKENTLHDFKLLERVVNNPTINSYWDWTKDYYTRTKQWSPMVQYGCETVESNLGKGAKWIAPKVPTESLKPLLVSVDDFGNRQLDYWAPSLESGKARLGQTVESLQSQFSHRLEGVDSYLKTSSLSMPLNTALERLCDRWLPEDASDKNDPQLIKEDKGTSPGPVLRAGRLSRRVQRNALAHLPHVTFHSQDPKQALLYCVDLFTVQHAIEVLSSHLQLDLSHLHPPASLGNLFSSVKETAQHSAILTESAQRLRALGLRLGETLDGEVPQRMKDSVVNTLQEVRDSLASLAPSSNSSEPSPANDNFVYYFNALHGYLSPRKESK